MAQTAKRYDSPQHTAPIAAPDAAWSGDVHGPVAALHQAIEDRFLAQYDLPVSPFATSPFATAPALPPVEALVRNSSRAMGWLVLAAAFFATFQLIG